MSINVQSSEYIVTLISFLTLKHFFVDFPLQSDWMISQKGYYGKLGGIIHAAIHGIFSFFIVFLFAPQVAFLFGFFDAIAHYHIDYMKMVIGRIHSYTPKDKEFWMLIGIDQYLHYMTYLVLIWKLVI